MDGSSLRPGPDWIPGTIAEVLGPVTYIVETDEGQKRKRHADQIEPVPKFLPSTEQVTRDTDALFLPEDPPEQVLETASPVDETLEGETDEERGIKDPGAETFQRTALPVLAIETTAIAGPREPR